MTPSFIEIHVSTYKNECVLKWTDLHLVSVISFSNDREVELSVLLFGIIANESTLNLFHLNNLMHYDSLLIY